MKRQKERGATIVEAALILLLLITIVFAVVDFARAYNIYQTMTNAAREGARYAVAPAPGTSTLPSTGAVQTKVQSLLDSALIKSATINVSTVTQKVNNIDMTFTQVDVQAPYDSFFVPSLNVTLSTQSRMRNETSQ